MDHHNMDHHNHMSMQEQQHTPSSHNNHHHNGMDMDMDDLTKRFWWSLILMVPIIIMAPFMGLSLPFTWTFTGSIWLVTVLATILFIVGTPPFFKGAKTELSHRKPAMMSLISMALIVTYFYSIYTVIANEIFHMHPHMMDFFWEFATLTVIMLLGHRIEMSVTMQAGDATSKLQALLPRIAHVKHDDMVHDMPLAEIKQDMILQVLAGESFPTDGIVLEGHSQVDESLMTGESRLIDKQKDSAVVGGTINGNGTLLVKVTFIGDYSFIGRLQQALTTSQDNKSQIETVADRVASWLFWVALVVAVLAVVIWLPITGLSNAINIAVTVLVIACPHALGLAVPMVIARTKSLAAARGILIKNRKALQNTDMLRYALMDKTGTLTTGQFTVTAVITYDFDAQRALAIMAALDQQSTHPLAASIVAHAKAKKAPQLIAHDVNNIAGIGVSGIIDQQRYILASSRYLDEHHIDYSPVDTTVGNSVSYLLADTKVIGAVSQGDAIKDSAKAFIDHLKAQHLIPVLVTGDNLSSAQKVAQALDIDDVHALVSPQDKIQLVTQYQQDGPVMMIGDGINDAPALAQADLSIAIGAGADVAQASADTVLVSDHLPQIMSFLTLCQRSHRKQIQNLWWGAGYNIFAIPLAAGVLAPIGFLLNPMIGAILMSASTILVALNALSFTEK